MFEKNNAFNAQVNSIFGLNCIMLNFQQSIIYKLSLRIDLKIN